MTLFKKIQLSLLILLFPVLMAAAQDENPISVENKELEVSQIKTVEKEKNKKDYSWIATGGSFFPGFLLHGSGHYILGDKRTSLFLMSAEFLGIASVVSGIALLAITGASPIFIPISVPLAASGGSLFFQTFFADLYGTLPLSEKKIEENFSTGYLAAGYSNVSDKIFSSDHYSVNRLEVWYKNFEFSPSIWVSLDGNTRKFELLTKYSLVGKPYSGSNKISLSFGGYYETFNSDGFSVIQPEIMVLSSYDLGSLSETLKNSFTFWDFGAGIEFYNFNLSDKKLDKDISEQLLLRFGFGFYLNSYDNQVVIYYNHRRDTLAGGASGALGFIGSGFRYFFYNDFGILMEYELGTAMLMNGLLCYRF